MRRHFGDKPQMFGKIVYGLPGDVVAHWHRAVTVNGRVVGYTKPTTRSGERLAIGPSGVIPAGCYYVGTPTRMVSTPATQRSALSVGARLSAPARRSCDPRGRCLARRCCLSGRRGLVAGSERGEARDFGQLGQTFPVIEADLLSTIEARLQRAQATGEMDRVNAAFAKRVEAKVRRPVPVAGITPAEERGHGTMTRASRSSARSGTTKDR